MFPRACQGRFKCGPWPVQKRPRSDSNAPQCVRIKFCHCLSPTSVTVCLSVPFGFEIRLQWFISPMEASLTLGPHSTPVRLFPHLGDLSVIILMRRNMKARRWRGCIPLHKLTLRLAVEKASV